jgi:hypothetical protein
MTAMVTICLYINGKQIDRVPVKAGAGARALIGDLGAQHGELAQAADEAGVPWLIEFRFSDGEHVRWGTDSDGMVMPMPVEDLEAALLRLHAHG